MKTLVSKSLVRWVGVVGFSLALAVGVGARDVGPLAAVVQAQAEGQHFMGSVLVAKGDTVVFEMSTGMANVEWNVPDSRTTKFRIGSLTKQFTATAILLLQEQGKLSIDDRLSKYLADVPDSWRPITLRQLLTHTSGVPDTADLSKPESREWEGAAFSPAALFKLMRNRPLAFSPGTNFSYCNTGYMLLGWAIERVSGQTYRDFLKDNIFVPLGMENSGYDSNPAILSERASGYHIGSHGIRNANYIDMRAPGAAGGLYATTGDLLTWTRALFGGRVLQRKSVEEMTTPVMRHYGFGLRVESKNRRMRFAHGGGINGFSSFLAYFPASDVTIVVLSNVEASAPMLEEKLEDAYFGDR